MKKQQKKPTRSRALARVVHAPATHQQPESALAIIERVAKDKDVDVDKLGKVIELQKDLMATQARIDFELAFNEMEPMLPIIKKRGKISGKNRPIIPFARLDEDVHPAVKPILRRFGFSIRHSTQWPEARPGIVRVVGFLRHRNGHTEQSAFEAPADASDYRSQTQSIGSTIKYGRRYTTVDLLNLTIEGEDDDGTGGEVRYSGEPSRFEDVAPRQAAPAGHHAHRGERISDKQRGRLVMIVKNSGRSEDEVRAWLQLSFGWLQYQEVTRDVYDVICNAVENPGDLPARR